MDGVGTVTRDARNHDILAPRAPDIPDRRFKGVGTYRIECEEEGHR